MLEELAKFGKKLATFVGDRTQFGVNDSDNNSNKPGVLDYHALLKCIHFDSYQPETNLFFNKKSKGFILEVYPLLGANEESINILTSLLTDVLPLETDLQFILWASPKIGETLDSFEEQRSKTGELYAWLAKKRTDYLREGAFNSLTSQGTFLIGTSAYLYAFQKKKMPRK